MNIFWVSLLHLHQQETLPSRVREQISDRDLLEADRGTDESHNDSGTNFMKPRPRTIRAVTLWTA
jgi:hypothetical protein